jgi:hypothetical protein
MQIAHCKAEDAFLTFKLVAGGHNLNVASRRLAALNAVGADGVGLAVLYAANALRIMLAAIFRSSTKRWYSRDFASASGCRNR